MNKKILSCLLVLSMLVGMLAAMPLGVMAASEPTAEALEFDVWDGTLDYGFMDTGDGTSGDPFEISSAEQWAAFAAWSGDYNNASNSDVTFEDLMYFELTANLDFNNKKDLLPVGANYANNAGYHVEGNGHTIKGIAMTGTEYVGLFSGIWGNNKNTRDSYSTISNLVITESSFTAESGKVGALMGAMTGKIAVENVYVDESVTVTATSGTGAGGFAGYIKNNDATTGIFEGCVFAGTVECRGGNCGGFIGDGHSHKNGSKTYKFTLNFTDCLVTGKVMGSSSHYSCGFVGRNRGDVSFTNCVYAGGPASTGSEGEYYIDFPFVQTTSGTVTATNCYTISYSDYGLYSSGTAVTIDGENTGVTYVEDVNTLIGCKATAISGWTKVCKADANDVRYADILVPDGVADFAPFSRYAKECEELHVPLIGDGSVDNPYMINTPEDWQTVADLSRKDDFAGKFVALGADIDFGGNEVSRIGNDSANFAGTFDGQGHVISGVKMTASAKDWGFGLIGATTGEAVVKNFVLTNSNFEYTGQASWGSAVVGEVYGTSVTVSNVFVTDSVTITATGGGCIGGLIGGLNGGTTATVSNCVFAGTIDAPDQDGIGGILGGAGACTINISNCLFAGEVISTKTNVGGISGGKTNSSSVISNCISVGTAKNAIICGQDGDAGNDGAVISNCYYLGDRAVDPKYEKEEGDTYEALASAEDIVGTDCGITVDGWTKRDGDYMLPTAIVNMFAASGKAIPQLYVAPALEGEGTVGDPYKIASAEDWETFIYLAGKKNFAGEYVVLTNDIDFEGFSITPIKHFAGTFNGQYHTMKNLTMRLNQSEVALFCTVGSGAVIENLRIENFDIRAKGEYAGAVACCAGENSTFRNIYVHSDVTVEATEKYAGGIIGNVFETGKTVTITNCVFAGTVKAGSWYAGGIVGYINGGNTVTVSNCLNMGTVTASSTYASGIAGASEATIINCVNTGKVTSNNRKGGICSGNPSAAVIITNCYSVDSIADIATSDSNGGTVTVSNCKVVKLTDLIGNNAQVPETFVKRGGDFAVPAAMNEYIPMLLTQQLYDGASVRISTPTGLRFRALLGVDYFNSINTSGNATFGIIIAPTDFVADRAAFIELVKTGEAGVDYVIIPVDVANGLYFGGADAGYYEFTGVLANIKEYNYDRPFSAIAYVEVDGEYHFSAYDEAKNSRSIEYVAHMAYEDTYYTQVEGYEYEIAAGAGVYSPYTAYQREKILLPFFNTNGTLDINFLSYNIRNIEDENVLWGLSEKPTYEYDGRNEKVLAYLTSCGADVIGLQEVSTLNVTGGTLDWFDTLNREEDGLTANGYDCFIGANLYTGDEYSKDLVNSSKKTMYNPIYYKADKYTLIEGGTRWFTDTPTNPSKIPGADTYKGLNYVVLEDNDTGVRFVYVNLHTLVLADRDKDGNIIVESGEQNYHTNAADGKLYHIQYMQIAYLRAILEDLQTNEELESCGLPMFIGGDFNNSYSTTTEKFNNLVVTTTVNDKDGTTIYDVNEKGTPSETVKITSARDTASSKDTMKSCPDGEEFNVTPDKNGTPIDLWYTSNLDGFVHCYQVIDNRFEEPNEAGDNNRYPSDHLPVKLYVTIYR